MRNGISKATKSLCAVLTVLCMGTRIVPCNLEAADATPVASQVDDVNTETEYVYARLLSIMTMAYGM